MRDLQRGLLLLQVAALFQRIQTELADRQKLVFVLIDEVESLTAARQAAMDGGEPADSIRCREQPPDLLCIPRVPFDDLDAAGL